MFRLIPAFYLLTICLSALAEPLDTPARTDEQQLRYLKETLWPKAYRTKNVSLLDDLLHPTFELVSADGARSSKSDELASLPEFDWSPEHFEFAISRLDIYADKTAIVSGTGTAKNASSCYSYQSSNVLVKEHGHWKAVLSHVSGYKPEC